MKTFIKIIIPLWALVIFAFWIGSACTWVSSWSENYRSIMVCVLIFMFLPAGMATDLSKDNDKLKKQ